MPPSSGWTGGDEARINRARSIGTAEYHAAGAKKHENEDDRFGDCKTAACHATRLICGICSSFRSIALSRFCNGGSTAFFNSATVFSRSPTRL